MWFLWENQGRLLRGGVSVLGLEWWTGSKLEEKVEKGSQAGEQQAGVFQECELWLGGNHLTYINTWMEMPYLR